VSAPAPFRAQRHLRAAGISLGDLVEGFGRSKTTWSRLLAGRLDTEPEGARAEVEQALRARTGRRAPKDCWTPDRAAAGADGLTTPCEEIAMQGQTLSEAARQHYRLFVSPFDNEALVSGDGRDRLDELYQPIQHRFAEARLVQAMGKAGFVALYGPSGAGKTTIVQRAERIAGHARPTVWVTPPNVERRKTTAMHISAEIIRQLTEEKPGRTANVRDAQAAEALREQYTAGRRVVLKIDEAHELPDTTVKDLKRFHECGNGYARYLAIVLVGQEELGARFDSVRNHPLREAIARCQLVHLAPMAGEGEVEAYMATRFAWVGAQLQDVFQPAAVKAVNDVLAPHHQQLPLVINNLCNAAMNLGYLRGEALVTEDEVTDVAAATPAQKRAWGLQ
jgi:type II secretory pathway predicted ATPase ExeA